MPNYRILKSVAHNWAHSFLSDCNFIEDTIMVQYILELCRKHNEPKIIINPITEEIQPNTFEESSKKKLLTNLKNYFQMVLESQGCNLGMINRIELNIEFDINSVNPKYSEVNKGVWYSDKFRMPEASKYDAWVYILDSRGRDYTVRLPVFWKY
jgi:hypothetical protein